MKPVTADDIGSFFIRPKHPGEVWEMITFCELPTATWRNVATREKFRGTVESRDAQEFVRLRPEGG